MKALNKFTFLLILSIFFSCGEENGELPYLGQKTVEDGVTVYHTVPDWKFMDQDSSHLTNSELSKYVYVADFFFTNCPSICPKVTKEMLKIYEEFEHEERIKLVSFTLDPKRDSPERLKLYAQNLDVNTDKWIFLHGEQDFTYELANEYFVTAYEDPSVPGGFDHSGKILLVDRNGHIRSFSEGTDPETTPKLIRDIKRLLSSYEGGN